MDIGRNEIQNQFQCTDYDCWHPDHENLIAKLYIKILLNNEKKQKAFLKIY